MLEGGRILRGRGDAVDLPRHRPQRRFEADEVLGRRERAQRVTNLAEPALDAGEVGGVGAGIALAVDALRQRTEFSFQRLDGLAWHGVLDQKTDLGEVVAQVLDRAINGLERFDLRIDVAQLLEAAVALGRGARQLGAPAFAVERALALRDLGQRLIKRACGRGWCGAGRRLGWGGAPGCARRPLALAGARPALDQLVEPAI